MPDLSKTERIRQLNDAFRTTFMGGRVVVSAGIAALPDETKARVLSAVRTFTAFNNGNDPHNEHDFVSVEIDDFTVFAKVDYYDLDLKFASDDPADPEHTIRVMTIMQSDEY